MIIIVLTILTFTICISNISITIIIISSSSSSSSSNNMCIMLIFIIIIKITIIMIIIISSSSSSSMCIMSLLPGARPQAGRPVRQVLPGVEHDGGQAAADNTSKQHISSQR